MRLMPSAATCARCSLVIAMFALGLGIGAYILANQRLRFPLRRGGAGEAQDGAGQRSGGGARAGPDRARVRACRSARSARSRLRDGHAVVELLIQPEYEGLIREDATALLRPKTPLKDMFLEVDPGPRQAAPTRATPCRCATRCPT